MKSPSRPHLSGPADQQAIAQVLTPIFDPIFSASSFGFRPGRSAHQAVRVARRCIQDGLEWVVDIDLDQFFDRVQFDVLLARVGGASAVPMVGSLVQCALRLSASRSRPARRSSCAGVERGAVSTIW